MHLLHDKYKIWKLKILFFVKIEVHENKDDPSIITSPLCQRHEICTTKQETQAKTGNEIVPTLPTSKWEKKGWKMSGKVANGKVTVVEYSKSAKIFFEIRVTNHSI